MTFLTPWSYLKGENSPGTIFIFWLLTLVLEIIPFRSLFVRMETFVSKTTCSTSAVLFRTHYLWFYAVDPMCNYYHWWFHNNYLFQPASVDYKYFVTYTIYFVLLVLEFFLCCFSDTSALSTSGPSGYHSLVGERQPLLQQNGNLKKQNVQPTIAVCLCRTI